MKEAAAYIGEILAKPHDLPAREVRRLLRAQKILEGGLEPEMDILEAAGLINKNGGEEVNDETRLKNLSSKGTWLDSDVEDPVSKIISCINGMPPARKSQARRFINAASVRFRTVGEFRNSELFRTGDWDQARIQNFGEVGFNFLKSALARPEPQEPGKPA